MKLRGSDYDYAGAAPHPKTATLLQQRLSRLRPTPAITPVSLNSAPGIFSVALAKVYWDLITQGYGIFAEYGAMWKAKGMPLTAIGEANLQGFAQARNAVVNTAYELVLGAGGFFICPREFYSLIEPSEKVAVSYAVGSGMTKTFGEYFIKQRAQPSVLRMYHARLLKAAAHCQAPVALLPPHAMPDFLGKAIFNGQSRYHVFESKGGEDISYPEIAKGITQAESVLSINGMPPLTRNICVTHHRAMAAVPSKTLVTRMLQLKTQPSRNGECVTHQTSVAENFDHWLDGSYLCGVALFFSPYLDKKESTPGEYHRVWLDQYRLIVAIRRDVVKLIYRCLEELRTPTPIDALTWLTDLGRQLEQCDQRVSVPLDENFGGQWSAVEGTWLRAQLNTDISTRDAG